MITTAISVCTLAVVLTLIGEARGEPRLAAPGKLIAASSYLVVALLAGALTSPYGRTMLAGLSLCWLGDLFLVARGRGRWFRYGLLSFLGGHVFYAAAFAARGTQWTALLLAVIPTAVFGWLVWRWLQPHVGRSLRRPVQAYVVVICVMMALAVATHALQAKGSIVLGALLFLLSDLFVARQRFVGESLVCRTIGLPLYFSGQLFLAGSVAP